MKLEQAKNEAGEYQGFAWPGGYPIVYVCNDGSYVCAKCMNDPTNQGWISEGDDRVIGADVYYEGPVEQCVNCEAEISSAYGDPGEE